MTILTYGWRCHKQIELTEKAYLALSPEIGRGVVKNIDDAWFFIKKIGSKSIAVPLSLMGKVFCLNPLRKQ